MAVSPIQLAAQAARAQRRRLPKSAPYKIPGAAERVAERRLGEAARDLVVTWLKILEPLIPEEPARVDASSAAEDLEDEIPIPKGWSRRAFGTVDFVLADAEREQRAAEARSMKSLGLDVIGGEPWLKAVIDERGKEASDLITKMAGDTRGRVASLAALALSEGRPRTWLRKQIQAVAGITERRAKLIARDQVRKLQGALHEARQTDLGIDSYIWRTSRDERVAGNPAGLYPDVPSNSPTHGDHHEREGRRFSWKLSGGALVEILANGKTKATNYRDGHCGSGIQCRCFAEPYIEGLEDISGAGEVAPVASGYKVGGRKKGR